jgi:hypothetical protein
MFRLDDVEVAARDVIDPGLDRCTQSLEPQRIFAAPLL